MYTASLSIGIARREVQRPMAIEKYNNLLQISQQKHS